MPVRAFGRRALDCNHGPTVTQASRSLLRVTGHEHSALIPMSIIAVIVLTDDREPCSMLTL
jgi:hypothetical protein